MAWTLMLMFTYARWIRLRPMDESFLDYRCPPRISTCAELGGSEQTNVGLMIGGDS